MAIDLGKFWCSSTIKKYMDQKEFNQILERYHYGRVTEKERQLVEKWYSSIEDSKHTTGIIEKFQLKWRIRQRLDAHKSRSYSRSASPGFPDVRPLFRLSLRISMAAAAIGFVIVGYIFLISPSDMSLEEEIADLHEQTITNSGTSARVVLLADGSRVTLSAGSIMQIADSFNKANREVFLRKGEGFFEVERDVTRPFFVYADKVVTKVLGTSFTIDASKPDIVVAVKTGRVSVFSKDSSVNTNQTDRYTEVILTPNQQAVYDADQGKMSHSLVKAPLIVLPAEDLKAMQFESTSVPVILDAVSKAYGVDIEYDSDLLFSCILTTLIDKSEDLYQRLEIICEAIGATYQVEGVAVKISGNGCVRN